MTKLKLTCIEYPSVAIWHEPVIINLEDYPELKGLDQWEINDYINENGDRMKPTDSEYVSLRQQLEDQNIDEEEMNPGPTEIWAALIDVDPIISDNFQIGPDGAYEADDDISDWDDTLLDGLEDE